MVIAWPKLESLTNESEAIHWQALLSDKMRQRAWATVREIAAVLPAALPASGISPQNPWTDWPPGQLVCWKAEIALFYAYLAKISGEAEFAERSTDYLNAAINEATAQKSLPHLLGGLTEIGWIIAHLAGAGLEVDATESCAALDEFLHWQLSQDDRHVPYDLYTGLVGYGVYALERGPEAAALAVKAVNRLQQTAEHHAQGTTWHTRAAWLPDWLAQCCPEGYYSLGVAHGVPGVIGLLAQVNTIAEIAAMARGLLDGAMRWMLANRRYDEHGAYFPACLAPIYGTTPAVHAWCYGELSAGTVMLLAAHSTGQMDWEESTLALLRSGVSRRMANTGVQAPGICHGIAGQAHLYNRIYQATGEEIFKQAALYWYERTLGVRASGQGLAGFQVWNGTEWTTSCPNMLEGVVGIGLVLLAAIEEVEPDWDRLLLAAVPPLLSSSRDAGS